MRITEQKGCRFAYGVVYSSQCLRVSHFLAGFGLAFLEAQRGCANHHSIYINTWKPAKLTCSLSGDTFRFTFISFSFVFFPFVEISYLHQ